MKFSRELSEGLYTIHAYREGEVTVNSPRREEGVDEEGRIALRRSFIISPQRLLREWPATAVSELDADRLSPLTELNLEVVLLGTGKQLSFPVADQLAALVSLGIGYEVMDSAAACRTYNILAGEGRQVGAAIIIEP